MFHDEIVLRIFGVRSCVWENGIWVESAVFAGSLQQEGLTLGFCYLHARPLYGKGT